jgi:hypothetical protein
MPIGASVTLRSLLGRTRVARRRRQHMSRNRQRHAYMSFAVDSV